MLSRNGPIPLYYQIREDLLEQLSSMSPNEQIESELELAEKFGVSRGTVKQAIQDLVAEGYLYRIQGKGTFVASPRIQRSFDYLPSFSDDIRRRGYDPGIKALQISQIQPPGKVASALNIGDRAFVWKAERVRLADGEPIAFVASYIPCRLLANLTEADISVSLYQALEEKHSLRPLWGHDTYTAVNASSKMAQLLEVPKGTALIYSERTAFLSGNQPVEFVESYIRGDRFVIHVDTNKQPKSDS